MEELKILTQIYKHNLKITIEPHHNGIFSSMIYRIDDPEDHHMKYELPVQEWQASAVQEPLIVSNVLARMVADFVNECKTESEIKNEGTD